MSVQIDIQTLKKMGCLPPTALGNLETNINTFKMKSRLSTNGLMVTLAFTVAALALFIFGQPLLALSSLTLEIFWIKKHLSLLDSNESIDKERKRLSADMAEVGQWLNRINSATQANRTRISAEELKALNQAHSFGCSILQKVQKILKE